MASHVYDIATLKLNDGTVSWPTNTIKVALVNSSYTFTTSHTNMTQVTSGELSVAGYARQTLGSKTETEDTTNHRTALSGANSTFTSLASGDTAVAAVVFYDPGTGDANTLLLAYITLSPSITTNGGNVTVTWDGTLGIMYLTAS